MKRIIVCTLLILLLFSAMTTVEATDTSSTTDGDNNGDGAEDSSPTPSPTDTNSEQKGLLDKIIDWLINSLFKSFGKVSYEDVKDPTEKVKNEGLFKEGKSDQNQKSEGPENQKEAYKVEITPLGEGVLGYDDGEVDGYSSIGPKGHAVFFSNDGKLNINGIEICGGRYDDTSREFDIEIWDNNFKTLYSATYDYIDFFPESYTPLDYSDLKWVTINVPNIEVKGNFYVAIFTYSGPFSWGEYAHPEAPKGGIAIGHDSNTKSGNSFVVDKNPNRIVDWPTWNLQQDGTDWMIRVSSG